MKSLLIFNLQKLPLKYLRMWVSNCGSLLRHQKNPAYLSPKPKN